MKILKVLQIIPDLGLGGAERMTVLLAIALKSQGIDVKVISLYGPTDSINEKLLSRNSIECIYLGKMLGFDLSMYGKLSKEIALWRPDIIHSHRYVLRYLIHEVFKAKFRWFHTIHNIAQKDADRTGRIFNRIAFSRGVIPIAIARTIQKSIKDTYNIDEAPIINNGIDIDRIKETTISSETRNILGIPPEATLFVTVGRMTQQKNHLLLIDSFSKVVSNASNTHLIIIGNGDLRTEIESLVSRLNLNNNISVLGNRDDVINIMKSCDVFVMSSDWEGHPLAILEAVACGLPVIATRVGGISEIVEEGVTGFLVQKGNSDELAATMLDIHLNADLRNTISKNCLRSSNSFGANNMATKYIGIYENY